VQRVYGDRYFQGGGDGYLDYLGEEKMLIAYGKRYGSILRQFMAPGTVLDVGCAAGFILKGFEKTGWCGTGIEPNPHMAEYARTSQGLDVELGSLEQFQSTKRYDLVSLIQVLPHFYDLRKALDVAAQLTKPRGYWLIETWNRESWTAQIFGHNWHEYSPPSVLHWFSREGLQSLVAQFGFCEVARGRPPKRISPAHAKSVLGYKLGSSTLAQVVVKLMGIIPDRLSIPYPGDDIFWSLYQRH
jgi:SAM-dependent methyltransferase